MTTRTMCWLTVGLSLAGCPENSSVIEIPPDGGADVAAPDADLGDVVERDVDPLEPDSSRFDAASGPVDGAADGPAPIDAQTPVDGGADGPPEPDGGVDATAGPCGRVGEVEICYPGPEGTAGVGLCQAGRRTCADDGWGPCAGAVGPADDTCDGQDEDCDGAIDEALASPCYDGPEDWVGVGLCARGERECVDGTFGACMGQVVPAAESCDRRDEDCDGAVDEGACECMPGADIACYSGPPGTVGVGRCRAGSQACSQDGELGQCGGEVGPRPERCDGVDDDCDGATDEGLGGADCSVGVGRCARRGQTRCRGGVLACDATPGAPAAETCNIVDDDCDGAVDERAGASCELEHATAACVAGACQIDACAVGFTDVDRVPANGCEAGCAVGQPEVMFGQAVGRPAVAFSPGGETIAVAAALDQDGIRVAFKTGNGARVVRTLDVPATRFSQVSIAPFSDDWGVAVIASRAPRVRFYRVTTAGEFTYIAVNQGVDSSAASLARAGNDVLMGYVGTFGAERQLIEIRHFDDGNPLIESGPTQRVWVGDRRVLGHRGVGRRQEYVGVAGGGAEIALQILNGGAAFRAVPNPPAGELSWFVDGDRARVFWGAANGQLGWVDVNFANPAVGPPAYTAGTFRDPVGLGVFDLQGVVFRNDQDHVNFFVMPDDERVVARDITRLAPNGWREHAAALRGFDLAVALRNAGGSVALMRGQCSD